MALFEQLESGFAFVVTLPSPNEQIQSVAPDERSYCYTYKTSHSAEIIGVALLVIGLVSFIGVLTLSAQSTIF